MKQLIEMTDEELAVRYIGGDNGAFDILLERNANPVYSYIFFMVHEKEMTEELFQETFLRIISKLQEAKYAPTGKFSAWCIRIAHNVIIDGFRSKRIQRIVEVPDDNDLSNVDSNVLLEGNIEDEYVHMQVLKDLRKMIALLPHSQREVVYMRFYKKLTFKEIASITNVSVNTSLGRMRYAILNLRKMAKGHNIELMWEK